MKRRGGEGRQEKNLEGERKEENINETKMSRGKKMVELDDIKTEKKICKGGEKWRVKKKKRDPKVGTGKKPKGSDRRLYTDENPKDTVSIKFATPADARATVAKVKKINKPFARKIQILTVLEQRAKVAKKPEQARIAKAGKEAIRKQHRRA